MRLQTGLQRRLFCKSRLNYRNMINIAIWMDFACPYCYMGDTRLMKAIENLGLLDDVAIELHSFQLDKDAPSVETHTMQRVFELEHDLTPDKALSLMSGIDAEARALGIMMNIADAKCTNTLDAHRLMKMAEAKYDRETVGRLVEEFYKIYFVYGRNIADRKVLVEGAARAGVVARDAEEVLDSDAYTAEVRQDEQKAASMGVDTIPYMEISTGFKGTGTLSVAEFENVLRGVMPQAGLKTKEKESPYAPDHICGPDGCRLL